MWSSSGCPSSRSIAIVIAPFFAYASTIEQMFGCRSALSVAISSYTPRTFLSARSLRICAARVRVARSARPRVRARARARAP